MSIELSYRENEAFLQLSGHEIVPVALTRSNVFKVAKNRWSERFLDSKLVPRSWNKINLRNFCFNSRKCILLGRKHLQSEDNPTCGIFNSTLKGNVISLYVRVQSPVCWQENQLNAHSQPYLIRNAFLNLVSRKPSSLSRWIVKKE